MKIAKAEQWFSLVCCVLMLVAVAIQKEGKVFGHPLKGEQTVDTLANAAANTVPTLRMEGDTMVVNTTYIGKDIEGYAGAVPMEVRIANGKVARIEALENSETPSFFDEAIGGLQRKWDGLTVAEAEHLDVDAVSGATYSSNAIIANVRLALAEAGAESSSNVLPTLSLSTIAGLIVVLMAAILPLFIKDKRYRLLQLALNVIVLGFWCGAFINYTLLIRLASSGLDVWLYLVPIVMLITAFVYPLFGKKQYYCSNVCPLGSLQQLAGKCPGPKLRLGQKTVRTLDWMRQILWAALMLCLWGGVWFEWIDYELFAAFLFQSAPAALVIAAVVFAVLSFFVQRPYCRFVCPTGTLLKTAELSK